MFKNHNNFLGYFFPFLLTFLRNIFHDNIGFVNCLLQLTCSNYSILMYRDEIQLSDTQELTGTFSNMF